jgi:hypothetical protein
MHVEHVDMEFVPHNQTEWDCPTTRSEICTELSVSNETEFQTYNSLLAEADIIQKKLATI